MAKTKKSKKTGKFEKDASDSRGVPFGWSETADDPSKPSKQKLPKVIHHDNSVKDTDGFLSNVKAMMALSKRIGKEQLPIVSPRFAAAEAALEKKAVKSDKPSKSKKPSKKEVSENDE